MSTLPLAGLAAPLLLALAASPRSPRQASPPEVPPASAPSVCIQREAGTWSRFRPEDTDLTSTAALLWALASDGHGPHCGPQKARVRAALQRVTEQRAFETDGTSLRPGEALAALAVREVAGDDAETAALALRARARLLETQQADGGWQVAGAAADDPRALEATGWAALVFWPHAVNGDSPAERVAFERARGRLAEVEVPVAQAFTLFFDASAGADLQGRFDALYRGARAEHRGPLLDLLAAATAYRVGGALWKGFERNELRALVKAQISGGERDGLWPDAHSGRGDAWELGLRLQSVMIHLRYARSVLVR